MGSRKPNRPRSAEKSKHDRLEQPLVSALAESANIINRSTASASLESEPLIGARVQERDSLSLGQEAPVGLVLQTANDEAEPMQVDEDELPGSEYNVVLTAPPKESIKCLGVVTTISEGRNDLPITDSEWAGIVFGDDEA